MGRFPEPGDAELVAGPSRNFQVFVPPRPPTARESRKGWAALIKQVYEAAPLRCSRCVVLVSQKAAYEILTAKIEGLHQQIQLLFEPSVLKRWLAAV